jgi:hypothetical protein
MIILHQCCEYGYGRRDRIRTLILTKEPDKLLSVNN